MQVVLWKELEFREEFFDKAEWVAAGAGTGGFLALFFGLLALGDDEVAGFGGDEGETDGDGEFRLSYGIGDTVETVGDADFDGGF